MKEQLSTAFAEMFDKLENWLRALITHLPNILVALVVFFLTLFLARVIRRLIRRWMKRTPASESVIGLVAAIGAVVIVIAGVFLILAVLNLDGVATGLLAGASISGLVIGLALQNTFANTFGGIVLSLRSDIRIGDWIETKGYAGEVQRITLRNLMIRTADNNVVYIPNKDVLDNPVKNHSKTTASRVEISCGVSYQSDLEKVKEITIQTLLHEFQGILDRESAFHYTEFGGSAIMFKVWFWISATSDLQVTQARSRAISALKKAYDQAGIVIPYPIMTVQLPKS